MKILVAGALLCALCAPVWAQDADAPTDAPKDVPQEVEASKDAPRKPEADKKAAPTVQAGELRLDGKVKAMLNVGQWQMEAISWTSPREVTTAFSDPKSKTITVGADAFIHPLGETDKVALKDVKLGARVAVIGKNAADGSLAAREVILLEGYGTRKTVGSLSSNPFTSALVGQSRKARDEGNILQALKIIDQAITAAQGINDLSGEGLATQDKTLLLFDNDQIEEAGVSAARVETIGRTLSNPLLITMGMTGRANVLMGTDQLDKAIEVLEAADPISQGSEPGIQTPVLSLLARAYARAGRPKDVIATYQRLFPLQESLRQGDDATRTMLSLASAQASASPDDARETLKKAVARIADTTDEKKRANLQMMAGVALYNLGDKDAASTDFETAAKLLEGVGDTQGAAKMRAMPTTLETRKNAKTTAPAKPTAATPDATE